MQSLQIKKFNAKSIDEIDKMSRTLIKDCPLIQDQGYYL